MVSTETVAAAVGAGKYALALEETCIRFGIVTALEKAYFIAQVAPESDGFATAREYASGRAYEGREDLGNVQMGGRHPLQRAWPDPSNRARELRGVLALEVW